MRHYIVVIFYQKCSGNPSRPLRCRLWPSARTNRLIANSVPAIFVNRAALLLNACLSAEALARLGLVPFTMKLRDHLKCPVSGVWHVARAHALCKRLSHGGDRCSQIVSLRDCVTARRQKLPSKEGRAIPVWAVRAVGDLPLDSSVPPRCKVRQSWNERNYDVLVNAMQQTRRYRQACREGGGTSAKQPLQSVMPGVVRIQAGSPLPARAPLQCP